MATLDLLKEYNKKTPKSEDTTINLIKEYESLSTKTVETKTPTILDVMEQKRKAEEESKKAKVESVVSTKPKVTQPATQPKVMQPATQPATQPKVIQPATQPKVTQPATQPKATQPEKKSFWDNVKEWFNPKPETVRKEVFGIESEKDIEKRIQQLESLESDLKYSVANLKKGVINIPKNIGNINQLVYYNTVKVNPILPVVEKITNNKQYTEKLQKQSADKWAKQEAIYQNAIEKAEKQVDIEKTSNVGRFIGDVISSVPTSALALIPGVGVALFGLSAAGSYAEEAEQKTNIPEKQLLYATIGGASEVIFEYIFGVIPGLKNILYGQADNVALQTIKNMVGEALEETSIDPVMGFAEKYILNPEKKWVGENGIIDFSQMGRDALAGATMSLMLSSLSMPIGTISRQKAANILKKGTEATKAEINDLSKTYAQEVKNYEKEFGKAPRVPTLDEQIFALEDLLTGLEKQNKTQEAEVTRKALDTLKTQKAKLISEGYKTYLTQLRSKLEGEGKTATSEYVRVIAALEELNNLDKQIEQTVAAEQPVAAPEIEQIKAEQPVAEIKTEQPTTETKAEQPTKEVKAEQPTTEVKAEQPTTEAKAEQLITEVKAAQPTTEAKAEQPVAEAKAAQPKENIVKGSFNIISKDNTTKTIKGDLYKGTGLSEGGNLYHLKSGKRILDLSGLNKQQQTYLAKKLADNVDMNLSESELQKQNYIKQINNTAKFLKNENEFWRKLYNEYTTKVKSDVSYSVEDIKKLIKQDIINNKLNKNIDKSLYDTAKKYIKFEQDINKEVIKSKPIATKEQKYIGGKNVLVKEMPKGAAGKKIIKLNEIEEFIRANLDIPVNYGRFRQRAKGIYKTHWQAIRLKKANDVYTLFHEVGHFLDDRLHFTQDKYNSELLRLGEPTSRDDYTNQEILDEGVAEFVRYYTINPDEARLKAPNFFKYFEEVISKQPNLNEFFNILSIAISNYNAMSPTEKLNSYISWEKPKGKKITFKDLYYYMLDDYYPLYTAVNEITGGEEINPSENPYMYARLLSGSASKAYEYLYNGIKLDTGMTVTRGLNKILEPVKDEIQIFINYSVAKRVIELSDRNIETGIDKELALQVLEEQKEKAERFDDVLEELYNYQGVLLGKLTEGILSEEQKEAINELNKNYVPFYRVIDDIKTTQYKPGKRIETGKGVHRIYGSSRVIINPLESIIKNTFYLTALADKSKVGLSLLNLAEKYPGCGKIIEPIPPKVMISKVRLKNIEQQLNEVGIKLDKTQLDAIVTLYTSGSYFNDINKNVITIYENGKPKYFEIHDEALLRVFQGMNYQSSKLINALGASTRLLRAGIILNPDYILKNPIRDSLMAAIISETGFIPVYDSIKGLMHILKHDKVYDNYLTSGAAGSTFLAMDRDYAQKTMRDLLNDDLAHKVKNICIHPIEILRAISEYSDEISRVRIYEKGIKKEGNKYENWVDVNMKAALEAKEGTIDFSRGGVFSKRYNKINAFFNSSLQGIDGYLRAFKRDTWGTFLKSVLYITLPTILFWLINHDDDRYKELSTFQKDMYWCIPTKKRLYKIPKPFEPGMIFGALAERILNALNEQDPHAFDDYAKNLYGVMSPDWMPDFMMPILEAYSNYDYFRMRRIVPYAEEFLEKPQQYSNFTSETAKLIGKTFNLSPRIIDHVIRGYTGGLGNYGIEINDEMLKFIGVAEDVPERKKDIVYKIPGIRYLAIEPYLSGSNSIDKLYTEYYDLTKRKRSAKSSMTDFPEKDARRLNRVDAAIKKISILRKRGNNIYESKDLTAEEKQQLLEEITIQQINIARLTLGEKAIKIEEH